MGYDYALVHLKYTIPPALGLTFVARPLLTRVDICKILFLITVAVTATIPWDSYLIKTRIWSYPPNAVLGPTLFRIPLEELFFFVVQTYNTSVFYTLLTKPTLFPIYLRKVKVRGQGKQHINEQWLFYKVMGMMALGLLIGGGIMTLGKGGEGTYMALIVLWAAPFMLLLWTWSYQLILGLPWTNTLLPIMLPTIYLWIVDTFALRRGTWVIEKGTKFGIHLWDGLDIEEAVFFLATNLMIVFGMITCDNALAIQNAFPHLFPETPGFPTPSVVAKSLFSPASQYDEERIEGLREAVERLKKKSRSFYLASGTFSGRLRLDLIILYSFCRVGDDLVDEAGTVAEAKEWIAKLKRFVDLSYGPPEQKQMVPEFVATEFPEHARRTLLMLPTHYLSSQPIYDLLKGFEMDLAFNEPDTAYPIKTQADLDLYGARVAGTVAELCLELVFHHLSNQTDDKTKLRLVHAGGRMGIALQYVNISRDIEVDAVINRIYIPTGWLKYEQLTHKEVLDTPRGDKIEKLRTKLLDRAFELYEEARPAIEELPKEARGPMRVAVESYMEIGRVLRQKGYKLKKGRATVPKGRRIRVAWKALGQ